MFLYTHFYVELNGTGQGMRYCYSGWNNPLCNLLLHINATSINHIKSKFRFAPSILAFITLYITYFLDTWPLFVLWFHFATYFKSVAPFVMFSCDKISYPPIAHATKNMIRIRNLFPPKLIFLSDLHIAPKLIIPLRSTMTMCPWFEIVTRNASWRSVPTQEGDAICSLGNTSPVWQNSVVRRPNHQSPTMPVFIMPWERSDRCGEMFGGPQSTWVMQ